MMREIINDRNTINLRLNFEPSLYALECLQRTRDLIRGNIVYVSHSCSCSRIPNVVFAGQRKFEISPYFSLPQNRPTGSARFHLKISDLPVRSGARSVPFHRTKSPRQATIDTL